MLPATSDRKVLRLNMAHSSHQLINVTDTAERSWRNDCIPGSKSVRGDFASPCGAAATRIDRTILGGERARDWLKPRSMRMRARCAGRPTTLRHAFDLMFSPSPTGREQSDRQNLERENSRR